MAQNYTANMGKNGLKRRYVNTVNNIRCKSTKSSIRP